MQIAVVAYPNYCNDDYELIEQIRFKHSPLIQYEPMKPHFTLVFPTSAELDTVKSHIKSIANQIIRFDFKIRCTIIMPARNAKGSHLFLVPDEGFSRIIRLHDMLYTGVLASHLLRDIPYIPHITIGYSDNIEVIQEISMEINGNDYEISGTLDKLTLISKNDFAWQVVQEYSLSA